MKFDARRHFFVERFAGRDEKLALIRERQLQRLLTLATARPACDQSDLAHENHQAYTIAPRVLTARGAARNFGVAPGAREAGSNPALPRNCVGGRRPIMPPLRREGGPEDEPHARRPAGSLTVCLPRGGWLQARISWSPIPRCEGSGFVFVARPFLRMLAAFELGGSSCGFLI